VQLIGATGSAAASINGIFDPTSPPEWHAGHLTYRKRDDQDIWLEYYGAKKQWIVRTTKDKGTDKGLACIASELRVDQRLAGIVSPLSAPPFLSAPPPSLIQLFSQPTGLFIVMQNGRGSLDVAW
jgi:hypothetical protein